VSRICAAVAALALAQLLAATPALARERLVRRIDREQGLPTTNTFAVAQDAQGFIWFGTTAGLVRWDGQRAARFVPDQIRGTVIWLAATPDGALYAALAGGGLYRLPADRTRAETVQVPGVTSLGDVSHLLVDRAGGLWVAATAGLFQLDRGGRWHRIGDGQGGIRGEHVYRLGVLRDGTVIGATVRAAYRVAPGPPEPWLAIPRIVGIGQAESGVVWVASDGDGGLWEVQPGTPVPRAVERGRWPGRTWDFAVRGDEAWMVMGGLTMRALPGGAVERIDEAERIPAANRVFVDREGSVWLGTGRGVYQLVEPATATFTGRDGLNFIATRFLARNQEGLWVATWEPGWNRIEDDTTPGTGQRLRVRVGRAPVLRNRMCVDGSGHLWTGSNNLLLRRRAGSWDRWPISLEDGYESCLVAPGHGVLLSSIAGLHLAAPGQAPRPLPSAAASMRPADRHGPLTLDRDGRLWMAGSQQVCHAPLTDLIAGRQAWACEPVEDVLDIYDIAETPSGALWIATNGRGVMHRRAGRWLELEAETAQLLPSRRAHMVERARDGQTTWLGGDGYVVRVREAPEGGGGRFAIVETLREAQGLSHVGAQDLHEDPDGTVWMTTDMGVTQVAHRARRPTPPPRQVVLVEARVDGRVPPGAPPWPLGSPRNHLELTFSALAFRDPRQIRYRVRLDDGAWSEPSPTGTLRLLDLQPGAHRIDVTASVDGLAWAALSSPIDVLVTPRWWQRRWLQGFGVLLLVAAIAGIQRARYAVRLRLAQQRARIAMDLHDDVGSGLGSIGILAGLAASGRVPAERQSEINVRVATTAERLGRSLTDLVAAMRDGSDRLEALVDLLGERGRALFPEDVPLFELRVPPAWPATRMSFAARRAVQLIALEALHNAARHARATRVELGVSAQGRLWRLWVADDGVGFAAGGPTRPGGGLGLRAMRNRAQAIGASLKVSDRSHGQPAQDGAGTRIEVAFDPLARERRAPISLRR
jgi:signal transduction histidine kinase/ligand-binding sensor domain-containing protein